MTTYLDARIKEAEVDGPVHEFRTGDSLHRESPDLPVDINVVEVKGGKYYRMWHAEDLTERLIHVNLMNNAVNARFTEKHEPLRHARKGDRVFVFERPAARPPELLNRCRLHPNDPERAEWDKMGLPVCKKPLANPYEVDRHMQKKHSTAWGTIERDRLKAERDEDRQAQRVMMDALARGVAPSPTANDVVEASPEPKEIFGNPSTTIELIPEAPKSKRVDIQCDVCSYKTWSTSKTKANNKLKKHKETHGN